MALQAKDLDIFSKNVKQKHDDLVKLITTLQNHEHAVTATWDGQAMRAFRDFMDRYYTEAAHLNFKLEQTADDVLKAHGSYTSLDQDVASQMGSQASTLNLPPVL